MIVAENPFTGNGLPKIANFKKPQLDLEVELRKALIDLSKDYPKPDAILSLDSIPMFTRGSISATIGKAKGGKTSFMALAVAAVLSGRSKGLTQLVSGDLTGSVLYFDTEQGQYYGSLTAHRIKTLAKNTDRLRYYDLREYSPTNRMELIRHAIQQEEKIALVIIDGGRDVIYDVNSPEEAINTMTELMELSVTYNTHINIVLHQNKGDMNARGHFGTELVHKSELVISVNKSEQDESVSVIHADFSRGLPFDDFAVARDAEGMPFISDEMPVKSNSKPSKMETLEALYLTVFGSGKAFKYGDAIEEIMRAASKSEAPAKGRFKEMKAHNMIIQGEKGEWKMNDDYNLLTYNDL